MFKSTSTSMILLGVLAIIAGVAALAWPGPTVLVLVLVVAIWAVIGGAAEFAFAFAAGETAVTFALLFGLFALCYGASQIAAGIQLRSAGQDVRTLLGRAA